MDLLKKSLIEMILGNGIIKTNFKQPITFKSGIKSPIYCDFRKCTQYPDLMEVISKSFSSYVTSIPVDVVVGVATGAISHASVFASKNGLPSAYVRPGSKVKNYGMGKLIEGADVSGGAVYLIEDLVSTGGSIIENYKILQKSGAKNIFPLSIFSYDMKESRKEFQEAGVELTALLTIHDILPSLQKTLSVDEYAMLVDWVTDPRGWFDRHKTKFDFGFLTTLRQATESTTSIISMGLDPVLEAMPQDVVSRGVGGSLHFYRDIFFEMQVQGIMPAMYKPNEGFYTKYLEGSKSLASLTLRISDFDRKIPVCIDAKRGDIGKSSQNYAEQYLGEGQVPYDAITISPFMGTDSVDPFIKLCNLNNAKGVYILNKTSNIGSNDFQMLRISDGRYMYQHVSDKIAEWAKGKPGVGAVVGGTSLEELRTILAFYAGKDIPVLVPGVGAQGGSAKDVANVAREVGFELPLLRINSSSGLTHPWYKKPGDKIPTKNECIEMCIYELKKLNEEVGEI